jgi:DNA polymerase-3 subunit delta'
MKPWSDIVGHTIQRSILDKHAKRKSWSHTYLFYGPEGVGKRAIAESFAGQILASSQLPQSDIQLLDAEPLKGSVEFVRQISPLLYQKSISGIAKVSLIDHAESLTPEAQNALLKILEEPKPDQVIILISTAKTFLPTLLSRLTLLHFNRSPQQNFEDLPAWRSLLTDQSFSKLLTMHEMADGESDELLTSLDSWLMPVYRFVAENPDQYAALRKLLDARELLLKNVNKKLVLQHMVL